MVLLVLVKELVELGYEPIDLGEIEWTEVLEEWDILQTAVNTKVEGIVSTLGKLLVRDPV